MIIEQLMTTDKAAVAEIKKRLVLDLDDAIYYRWTHDSTLCYQSFPTAYFTDNKPPKELREFLELLDGNGFRVEYRPLAYVIHWEGSKAKEILEGPPPYLRWQYENFGDYYKYWRMCQDDS